jgi:hypothetical protein
MHALDELLRRFYVGVEPLGVAFVGSARLACSFGRPCTRFSDIYESARGFVQYHLEYSDISLYVSCFEWDRRLVVQFSFQDEEPPPMRPWLEFVQLAAAVARVLEDPDDSDDSSAGVAVPRPDRPRPRARATEAASDSDADRI